MLFPIGRLPHSRMYCSIRINPFIPWYVSRSMREFLWLCQCVILFVSQFRIVSTHQRTDGGWLRANPLPADKSNYGNFEALAQQNKQVLQRILESKESPSFLDYDAAILRKLRDFYSSCLNEDRLDEIGVLPLLKFVQTLKKIYRNDLDDVNGSSVDSIDDKKSTDLTAALAYLHSQGRLSKSPVITPYWLPHLIGVGALFSFDIEGDVGVDPNQMVLWFSQPDLGLPSKVWSISWNPALSYFWLGILHGKTSP